jgi:signal transduction histidine kinase
VATTVDRTDHRDERVLVLAPTGRDAELAEQMLGRVGVASQICDSVASLCREIDRGAGLALVAEEALASASPALAASLARQPAWSDFPLVILTAEGDSPDRALGTPQDLEQLGNITLLERPVRVMTLISAVASALRARRRQYEIRDQLARLRRSEAERERLLASEQAARAEVEAANRAKDQFLAILSHELRTPLQSILGWVKVLRSGTLDAAATARALATIERNSRTQAQLIEDLLDVSRIVAGKLALELRPIDLVPVLDAAVDAVRGAAEAKDIQIATELDAVTVDVQGDPYRLQQVLWNLLSNAVKFTPERGRIDVRLSHGNEQASIAVADTGRGIRPDLLACIFDPFRQADSTQAREHGGLGLGLAIVRHLVEAHGGTVRAHSAGEGMGAAFTVSLPTLRTSAPDARLRPAGAGADLPAATAGSRLRGVRILVVDDNADTCELLRTVLRQEGAEVATAMSAEEALGALARVRPDVLISDISMPGEDGYALMRKVRAQESARGGRIAAIALTAHARPEDTEQAYLAGFQAHLAKPVDSTRLAVVIARMLAAV